MTKHMIKKAIPFAVAVVCSQMAFAQTSALNALPGTKPVETLQAEKMAPVPKEAVAPAAAADTAEPAQAPAPKAKVLSVRNQVKEEPEAKKPVAKNVAKPVSFRVIKGEYVEAFAAPDVSKASANDTKGRVLVSDRDWNHFTFGSPVKSVFFSQGTPIAEEGSIQYLANNTQVLVQFERSYDKPVQMVVELANNTVEMLYLQIKPVAGPSTVMQVLELPLLLKLKRRGESALNPALWTSS